MSGKHYNRVLRVHKLYVEGLERLLLKRFDNDNIISDETHTILKNLAKDPSKENLERVLDSDKYLEYFDRYQVFQDSIRSGEIGKTAQFLAIVYRCHQHDIGPDQSD